jgi:hypothetical protein
MGLPVPLYRSCSGSKPGAFSLASTEKYVKNLDSFNMTQETNKTCSFFPRKKKRVTPIKIIIKVTVFQTIFLPQRKKETSAAYHCIQPSNSIVYIYQFNQFMNI